MFLNIFQLSYFLKFMDNFLFDFKAIKENWNVYKHELRVKDFKGCFSTVHDIYIGYSNTFVYKKI